MLNLEKCELVGEEKEAPAIREQIEGIGKMLYETELIMEDTISNIIGKPTPEHDIPKDNCLQATFTEVKKSAISCMEMAKRIQNLIF